MTSLALLAAANLLLNPSFEDWPEGQLTPTHWSTHDRKHAAERIYRLTALGTDGETAVGFLNGSMGNSLSQSVRVEPGKYYNLSVDVRTDVKMYQFRMMPYWQDAAGHRLKDANKYSGLPNADVKTPWHTLTLKNFLAPTNAARLVVSLVPNDCWSNRGVPGKIEIDNARVWESSAVREDAPVAIAPTDALEVLGAELRETYSVAGLHVRGGAKAVTARLVAEESIEGGRCVVGGEKEFRLAAGEEASVFLPLETSTPETRLTLFVGEKAVWRRTFAADERSLRLDLGDRFDVRKGEVFVPNDARWYCNFLIGNNLPAKKGNTNREFGNPTNLAARMFFEVPKGIEILGVKYSDWGGDNPYMKVVSAEERTLNGQPVVRYELPVMTVSGVKKPLVFFRSSRPAGDRAAGRAWMTWCGGAQVPRPLTFTTVSYGRVKPFERMQLRMDDLMPNLISALSDDPARELPTLGVNAMRLEWEPSKKRISYPETKERYAARIKRMVGEMKAADAKWYFHVPNELSLNCWYEPTSWGNHANLKGDPDAAYRDLRGEPIRTSSGGNFVPPCPNYRGTNFLAEVKWVLESEAVRDYGVTWIVCDWEYWAHPCFCDRCRRIFRTEWAPKRGYPDWGDPKDFMADPDEHKEAAKAYREFFSWSRGQMYVDFRKELDKGLDPKRTDWCAPIAGRFMISDWISPRPHLLGGVDCFDWSFGYKTPESTMADVENIFTNVLKGVSGNYTCSICPMQGCELCFLYPPNTTYYNILEAATLGARGFEWWYAPICESMTWKYVMDGLRAIRPFEDIILDGKVKVRGEGENCTWRRVSLGAEALYCVRNYTLKEPATVRFTTNGREGLEVRDAATGERICTLHDGRNTVELRLDPANLARLLYVGARFAERQAKSRVCDVLRYGSR